METPDGGQSRIYGKRAQKSPRVTRRRLTKSGGKVAQREGLGKGGKTIAYFEPPVPAGAGGQHQMPDLLTLGEVGAICRLGYKAVRKLVNTRLRPAGGAVKVGRRLLVHLVDCCQDIAN